MRKVLVVDDNPQVRKRLCEVFKREVAFDVCGEAENGREAIDKANSLQPDLVVMDFSMPVLNGLEGVRLLKGLMPDVPVIIYTAHSGQIVETEARAAGAAATVSKSESVEVLVRTIRRLLDEIAAGLLEEMGQVSTSCAGASSTVRQDRIQFTPQFHLLRIVLPNASGLSLLGSAVFLDGGFGACDGGSSEVAFLLSHDPLLATDLQIFVTLGKFRYRRSLLNSSKLAVCESALSLRPRRIFGLVGKVG